MGHALGVQRALLIQTVMATAMVQITPVILAVMG